MHRYLIAAIVALGLFPHLASAVEIKNIRPCYAPFGATRTDLKLLPGDVLVWRDILVEGSRKARGVAAETMARVREAVKLRY